MVLVQTLAFLALFLFHSVRAFTFKLEPSQKECYYATLKTGDQLLLGFHVLDGPDYQVDFWLTNPSSGIEVNTKQASGYEHTINAKIDGRYTYCFQNMNPQKPDKTISFYTYRELSQKSPKEEVSTDPLEKELQHLKTGLRGIKDDQEYIVVRERSHRNTAESSNSRVVWWSLFQTGMLVATCAFQVFYLKQFFEVKRVV